MTPFGMKIRALRAAKGLTLKKMATDLEISSAYLSALEHGKRGQPSRGLVIQICQYFEMIWEEADEIERLASLSHPRAVVDTADLGPAATELANRLARDIGHLDDAEIKAMLDIIQKK